MNKLTAFHKTIHIPTKMFCAFDPLPLHLVCKQICGSPFQNGSCSIPDLHSISVRSIREEFPIIHLFIPSSAEGFRPPPPVIHFPFCPLACTIPPTNIPAHPNIVHFQFSRRANRNEMKGIGGVGRRCKCIHPSNPSIPSTTTIKWDGSRTAGSW